MDIAQRQGVFNFPGKSFRSSISYHAPSKRYLWTQTLPAPGGDPFSGQRIRDFRRPGTLGARGQRFFSRNNGTWPRGNGSFPTKWMSDDGKTLYLVFSGDDSFSVRMATLTIEAPARFVSGGDHERGNPETINGATVNGVVNPNGQATTAWFEWGTDPTLYRLQRHCRQALGSGTTSQAVNAVLSGLSPGATYYFRVAASNDTGTTKGSILGFSTTAIPAFNWNMATPESQGLDTTKLDAMWSTLRARSSTRISCHTQRQNYLREVCHFGRNQRHATASMTKGLVGGVSLMVAMNDGLISPDNLVKQYVPQWADRPHQVDRHGSRTRDTHLRPR